MGDSSSMGLTVCENWHDVELTWWEIFIVNLAWFGIDKLYILSF